MALTPIDEVREWVGSQPDDTVIYLALDANDGDAQRTALHLLRVRYADMVANPAKWSVVDDYSQDGTQNLKLVAAQIARLEDEFGVAPVDAYGWDSVPICGPGMIR